MSIFPLQLDPLSPVVGNPTSTTGSPVLDTALDVETSAPEEVVVREVEPLVELPSLEVVVVLSLVGTPPPESPLVLADPGPHAAM